MKNYSKMLQSNCDENTKSLKYLRKLNKEKCNVPGNTHRETLSNRSLCYDNIGKEIISRLDMESNCVMYNLINKLDKTQDKVINNQKRESSVNKSIDKSIDKSIRNQSRSTQDLVDKTSLEGPNFINQWDKSTYDTKKAGGYSDISLSSPYIMSNSLSQISKTNII